MISLIAVFLASSFFLPLSIPVWWRDNRHEVAQWPCPALPALPANPDAKSSLPSTEPTHCSNRARAALLKQQPLVLLWPCTKSRAGILRELCSQKQVEGSEALTVIRGLKPARRSMGTCNAWKRKLGVEPASRAYLLGT